MSNTTKWVRIPGLVTGLLLTTAVVGFGQSQTPTAASQHPHIEAAMAALNKAASELESAGHNFGGHRAKALQLVKQAQGQLREALAWAKAHPAAKK